MKSLILLSVLSLSLSASALIIGEVGTVGDAGHGTVVTAIANAQTNEMAAKQARLRLATRASEICSKAGAQRFQISNEKISVGDLKAHITGDLICLKKDPASFVHDTVVIPDSAL